MTKQEALYKYLLQLGDNALIQSHRLSEWCSKGPILEEDLALTNIALDYIGRAQNLLQYAGEVKGNGQSADHLAYRRPEHQYYNNLIAEMPKGDFAFTIAKQLLISTYELLLYTELCNSKDETLAGIAGKAIKEVRYHWTHARDWCYRLGKGTVLSNDLLKQAVNDLWMYTGEQFEMGAEEILMANEGIGCDNKALQNKWLEMVQTVLTDSNIKTPADTYSQTGGRKGIHTENMGHILSEMQYLQRAYPDAIW
ncbi:MAG: 1,2-phenylacetyl-CoA epoxidase subunit PaaC [Chitinophagaceae bacterium]|jgi:ring-1,2-phenylacetyl-CoA epoxidase subunit PaaC